METTERRAVMPMTTPRTVRKERILFSRRVVRAIRAFSPMFMRMVTSMALTIPGATLRWVAGLRPGGPDKRRRKRQRRRRSAPRAKPRERERAWRSEERRVGKECRCRGSEEQYKIK